MKQARGNEPWRSYPLRKQHANVNSYRKHSLSSRLSPKYCQLRNAVTAASNLHNSYRTQFVCNTFRATVQARRPISVPSPYLCSRVESPIRNFNDLHSRVLGRKRHHRPTIVRGLGSVCLIRVEVTVESNIALNRKKLPLSHQTWKNWHPDHSMSPGDNAPSWVPFARLVLVSAPSWNSVSSA